MTYFLFLSSFFSLPFSLFLEGVTDDVSGVPAAELPVPLVLHEAVDARTFPRLEANLLAYEGGRSKQTNNPPSPLSNR